MAANCINANLASDSGKLSQRTARAKIQRGISMYTRPKRKQVEKGEKVASRAGNGSNETVRDAFGHPLRPLA